MDRDEEAPYIKKIMLELEDRKRMVFRNGNFKCPFGDKLKDGEKDTLIKHARAKSIYGRTDRVRERHLALMTYMLGSETDLSKKPTNKAKKEIDI